MRGAMPWRKAYRDGALFYRECVNGIFQAESNPNHPMGFPLPSRLLPRVLLTLLSMVPASEHGDCL